MKTVTFIRHAESVANAGGITMSHDAIPLSNLGVLQAQELATALDVKPTAVLVSNFVRTHQTAQPYCERFGIRPEVCSYLDEFSVIDPELIVGMNGTQRKPFVKEYWNNPDPFRRMGIRADTFAEFNTRVLAFVTCMSDLPDSTIIFGHGIWFALLLWRLLGYTVNDAADMRSFRNFQLGLPMPNCAVFTLNEVDRGHWNFRANSSIARLISSVRVDIGAFLEDAITEGDAIAAQETPEIQSWRI